MRIYIEKGLTPCIEGVVFHSATTKKHALERMIMGWGQITD